MCAWGTSWSCWLFGLLVGRPKIFLPVALGCTYQVYLQQKQHQPPELSGHQAIEEEIKGTVEQSHHIHQLTQRCVTVHEKLRWKLDQQISTQLLYIYIWQKITSSPRAAERILRMPWGTHLKSSSNITLWDFFHLGKKFLASRTLISHQFKHQPTRRWYH